MYFVHIESGAHDVPVAPHHGHEVAHHTASARSDERRAPVRRSTVTQGEQSRNMSSFIEVQKHLSGVSYPASPETGPTAHGAFLRSLVLIVAVAAMLSAAALAQEGGAAPMHGDDVITIESTYGFEETTERLEQAIADEGLMLVMTIDHAANAADAGMELPPTTLFVFGNPEAGTPLMQAARTVALDLPQKMLVWQDDAGVVFVSWRDPGALARDHGLAADHGPLPNITGLLEALARSAAGST